MIKTVEKYKNYILFCSPHMLKLLNEVVQDLNLSPEEAQKIKFFVLSQPEPRGWGFLDRSALLGYPLYFHYSRADEVD